jgi:hypothetical protein
MVPGQSVIGRLGVAGDTGPSGAISFARVLSGLGGAQSANKVWAGPTSGGAAAPTFRSLVGADLPNPGASSKGGVQSITCSASNWFNTLSTGGVLPITITWGLSGLWHGASSTYIMMGLLFGIAIVVNRAWQRWGRVALPTPAAWALTFFSNVAIMVFFRADSLSTAMTMLGAMARPVTGVFDTDLSVSSYEKIGSVAKIIVLVLFCIVLPNTAELTDRRSLAKAGWHFCGPANWLYWRAGFGWALFTGILLGTAVLLRVSGGSNFIYFQF